MVAQMMCVWCWSIHIKETWVGGVACSHLRLQLEASENPPRFIFISSALLKIHSNQYLSAENWYCLKGSQRNRPVITLFPLCFLSNLTLTSFETCPLWKLAHRSDIHLPCQVFPIESSWICCLTTLHRNLVYPDFSQPPPSPVPLFPTLVCFAIYWVYGVVCDLGLELSMGTWSSLRALG